MTLGRLVQRYTHKMQGTVYKEMTRILPSGIIWPKKFKFVPGTIWPGTLTYFIQSIEKHILNLECNTQSDLYTITELQQKNNKLKRDNNKLKTEKREMQEEIKKFKKKLKAQGVEVKEEEPEVETSGEEDEPKAKRRNHISGREYRMLFSP